MKALAKTFMKMKNYRRYGCSFTILMEDFIKLNNLSMQDQIGSGLGLANK